MDWLAELIGPDKGTPSIGQMAVRGIVIFAYGLALLRIAGHRVFGKLSAFDLMLSIIIGSNLSRALTGTAPFIATIAATTVLLTLHWVLARLTVRWHWLGWLLKGSSERLAMDGRADDRALLRHGISRGDLDEALRQNGQMRLKPSQSAYLERNGKISIVETEGGERT